MKRTLSTGYIALGATGTQQPVFGTALSAASVLPGAGSPLVKIAVTSSAWFKANDLVLLDPLGTHPEQLYISSVPDSTHVVVNFPQFVHSSGVWLQLAICCVGVFVQCQPGNTGAILIGTKGVKYSTLAYGIALLEPTGAAVQPVYFADPINGLANAMKTDDYWFDGADTGDKILASCTVM